jgi:putative (di)nucleoside polyphosphate hydrolase
MSDYRYRPNVAAIIRKTNGKILLGERSDVSGAWQFPQGGIKKSENPEQALARELLEELSLKPSGYRVIEKKGPYRYLFATGRVKEGFHGQEQTYFLVELLESESRIDPNTKDPEFRAIRWIDPEEFQLAWVPKFKRDVYRQVLLDFFPNSGISQICVSE